MKSLNNYISQSNNEYLQFVQESLDNNTKIINESKLITEHGKDIDNLLFKTNQYFNNHIYGLVSESENDYKFTLDEQQTARDLLIYCLEDYKEVLLNECNIYEGLLNDTLSINEAEFQLGAAVSNLWKQGKDKVVKIYNDAKTKIKEINELIIMFAKKSFKSLKEFANKIVDVLETLGNSLLGIAKRIGFGEDKVAEISDELAIDIKNNPDKITKSDIFESLGKEINEGVVDWIQNSKAGKWYADKKQKPLWNAFFQVCNWLLVCKVLPAVVLAVFPGGLIYYITSIVIKVIWNIKKLKGLIKQTQDYVHSWNTMTTWEKIWKAVALLAVWYLWFNNVMSIAGNISKVGDAVKKAFESGELWKQMFGQAHTGIEPDKLEAMGAAVIRWIGKGFSGSIGDAYDEIMNACKEATGTEAFEAAKKAIEEGKAAAEAAKKTMENTESLTKEIEDEVKNFDGNKSTDLLNKIKSLCNLTPGELKDKIIYRVWVDGTATTKAAWLKNLIEEAKAAGMDESVLQKTQDLLNNSLHAVDSGAGSVSFMELPGEMVKFAAGKDLLGKNGWFGIVGEIAKNVATGGGDLPAVVASFSSAMATDVPIITFKQKGNGFRVRLGDKDSKNYIYEVGKDDVKFVKPTEIDNNKVKSAYENIKKVITEENKKFIEKIKNSDLKEDEKKKIIKQVEIFDKGGKDENGNEHKPYAEELAKTPLVVIYGSRLDKEEQEKYDGKESLKSLKDYLTINEGNNNELAISNYIDTINEINTLICKVYNVSDITNIKKDELNDKLKNFYDKNVSDWIDKLKKLNDELDKQGIKWCIVDGKLSLDANIADEKYKSIRRQLAVLCHQDKRDSFKKMFDILLNTTKENNLGDNDVFTKIFNGEKLSDDDIKKAKDYLDNKFTKLSDDDLNEIISKINDLAKQTNDEEVKESLEYEKILILEGITNKNIITSLDNIRKWLANYIANYSSSKKYRNKDDFETYKDDEGKEKTRVKSSGLSEKLNKIFSKDKFNNPNLDKDFKTDVAKIIDQYLDFGFDNAGELVVSIHKLYDSCSKNNKELKDGEGSKENNNDITKEQKLLYNHIIELLSSNCKDFKKELDNKNIDVIKSIKIKDSEKEELKDVANNIKKDIQKEKPKDDGNDDDAKDIINKLSKDNDEDDNDSLKSDLLEIYKKIIKTFSKDKQFKDDVKDNQYKLLPGVDIEESHKSLKTFIISEGSELTKKDFKTTLKELKDYLLKKLKDIFKKDDKKEIVTMKPKEIVKSMGVTYEPEEKQEDDKNVISGELPGGKEIKQLPDLSNTSKDNDQKSDNEDDQQNDDQQNNDDESGHQPVLIFSNVYGMDIAKANEKGPRKEIYSLKGAFHSLEFIEIKGGMNKYDIQEMLGEWMHTMVNNLCNITAVSPFEKKKNWWKDKFIPSKNLKENEERREFGNLTNGEIADIMNKKENAKNYVLSKTNNISIAQNEKDKDYLAKKEEKYAKKLENPDEKTVELVKAAYPDAIDKDGKIKKDYKDENGKTLPQIFSDYSLAKRKAEDAEKSGGLFAKLKNFVKGLFGGDKERGKKVNSALTHLDESLNEYNLDLFLEEMFKPKSLKEFILENKK